MPEALVLILFLALPTIINKFLKPVWWLPLLACRTAMETGILEVCVTTNRASHHWPGQTGNQGKIIQEVDPMATIATPAGDTAALANTWTPTTQTLPNQIHQAEAVPGPRLWWGGTPTVVLTCFVLGSFVNTAMAS